METLEHELIRLRKQIKDTADLEVKNHHLEDVFQRSQKRFKTIFEESPLGNKIVNANLEIIQVNRSLVSMLGYSVNELRGRQIINFAPAEFVQHWKTLQKELWTNGRSSFTLETILNKKDGSSIWCHVNTILIEDFGQTLGYTILEDISERKELQRLADLTQEREHRQHIAETILNTQEQERKRIAEDLHNGLGQNLFAVKLSLSQFDINSPECQQANKGAIRKTEQMISDCILECRRISHDLTPAILEEYGLIETLKEACHRLSHEVVFSCVFKGPPVRLERFLENAIYRIVQECMMNVVKHSKATHAIITLLIRKTYIKLNIEDNGIGFDPHSVKGNGIGLMSIESKVTLLSGKLSISSKSGQGTNVSIKLPKHVD